MTSTIRINREYLLSKLESVRPGLSPRAAIVQQSDCVVFKGGRLYTFNDDTAARAVLKMDGEIEGAVNADKMIEILRRWSCEEVALKDGSDRLNIIAPKGKRAWVPMEAEIFLPIGDVD